MNKLPILRGPVGRVSDRLASGNDTSKIGPVSMNRTVASAPAPSPTVGGAERAAQIDTFFTRVVSQADILYNADRLWSKLTLTLETAGPVAVGQNQDLYPVLSGKGQLLETGVPLEFFVAKGTRMYIAATGVNRIKRVIEGLPWMESMTGLLAIIAQKA